MAKIVSRVLSFVPVTGVTRYNVYVHAANTEPNYDDAHETVASPAVVGGRVSIDLAELALFRGLEGLRDVAVTALDEIGNESDFLEIDGVSFDFSPPTAPTVGRVD